MHGNPGSRFVGYRADGPRGLQSNVASPNFSYHSRPNRLQARYAKDVTRYACAFALQGKSHEDLGSRTLAVVFLLASPTFAEDKDCKDFKTKEAQAWLDKYKASSPMSSSMTTSIATKMASPARTTISRPARTNAHAPAIDRTSLHRAAPAKIPAYSGFWSARQRKMYVERT